MRRLLALTLAVACLAPCAVASPPTYRVVFTDREQPPEGASFMAISAGSSSPNLAGQRSGGVRYPNFATRATRWTPEGGHEFVDGLPVSRVGGSLASDMNELGHVDGKSLLTEGGLSEAFIWKPETGVIVLPWLDPDLKPASSVGELNEFNWVIGAADDADPPGTWPTLWRPNSAGGFTISSLGDLGRFESSGETTGGAQDVNNDGTVVGQSTAPECVCPFIWTEASGMQQLPLLPGGDNGAGRAINDHGWIVGFSNQFGVLWRNGQVVPLTDDFQLTFALPNDINNRNQIVGELGSTAFLWQDETRFNLVDLIDPSFGVTSLRSATDINDAGIISAIGTVAGEVRGFLLVPIARDCPADIDEDGKVGAGDLVAMIDKYGKTVGFPDAGPVGRLADLNDDGAIGPGDLLALLASWRSCAGGSASAAE